MFASASFFETVRLRDMTMSTIPLTKKALPKVRYAGEEKEWGMGVVYDNMVFLSGSEGRDPQTDRPVKGVRAQTVLCLEKIRERLALAGASMDDIVKFVWYLKARRYLREFYRARDEWLGSNAPRLLAERSYASTLLIVELAQPGMLVEIDTIAKIRSGS